MKYYLVLGFSVITNAIANILLKYGMQRAGDFDLTSFTSIWDKFVLNIFVWLGAFLFGVAFVSYSYVLTYLQVNIAYALLTSLAIVVVALLSAIFLQEKLTLIQFCGVGVIIIGIWLLSK